MLTRVKYLGSKLEADELEKEFQEVFSFVETITGKKCW
jgi:hypothetical protein